MADRRFIAIAVSALLFIVTGVVAVALLGRGASEPLGWTLAIGTFSSLIATMIASVTHLVGAVNPKDKSSDGHAAGLISVRPKHSLTSKEWLGLLQTAKTEFYVAGHSLGKWCSPSNRAEFTSHVRRILDGNGRVTLVMLDPLSPQIARLQRATSVDYTSRIQTSLGVLANLRAGLPSDVQERLVISVLQDPVTLPYMVVGNDHRMVTATYLGSIESDDVLCMELQRSSDAAAPLYDDFHKLAAAGTVPTLPPATDEPGRDRAREQTSLRRFLRRKQSDGS